MKKKKIKIPIFHGELTMIQTKKKKWSKVGEKYKMQIGDFSAVVWKDEKQKFLSLFVAFNGKPKSDIIAHEAVHLVNHVFINKGIEPCRYNDENQAYLTGWFVKQIQKFIK